ncbi:unnamed protein product [Acanthosepion pharaonis]|uniref:Uncharacterized protein n=1 Tax=Acanthosepion pharaonis TaxID=158019 RepID=A0A812CSB9_ACAPH|nr:unnamed protein product [Sepia pharaonis]
MFAFVAQKKQSAIFLTAGILVFVQIYIHLSLSLSLSLSHSFSRFHSLSLLLAISLFLFLSLSLSFALFLSIYLSLFSSSSLSLFLSLFPSLTLSLSLSSKPRIHREIGPCYRRRQQFCIFLTTAVICNYPKQPFVTVSRATSTTGPVIKNTIKPLSGSTSRCSGDEPRRLASLSLFFLFFVSTFIERLSFFFNLYSLSLFPNVPLSLALSLSLSLSLSLYLSTYLSS